MITPAPLHNTRPNQRKFVLQGLLFICAGFLVAAFPLFFTYNIEVIIGFVLMITGLLQLILTLRFHRQAEGLFSSLSLLFFGSVLVFAPIFALFALTTLLALFMVLQGFIELTLAYQLRFGHGWKWMLYSGVATLIIATLLLLSNAPLQAFYLGLAVALNLVFYGASLLRMARIQASRP